MVSVLAIGSKFRRLKPGRDEGLLRAIKIRNTRSFRGGGGGVNPGGPRGNILRTGMELYGYEANIS
jgi:hypothetical protein